MLTTLSTSVDCALSLSVDSEGREITLVPMLFQVENGSQGGCLFQEEKEKTDSFVDVILLLLMFIGVIHFGP